MNGIIYLVYVREFLLQGLPIYKIGKTEDICSRIKQYPKGSILIYSCYSDNIKKSEDEIIKLFSTKFRQRKDIGTESFEGDLKQMIQFIHTIVNFEQSYQIQLIEKKNESNVIEKYDKDKIFKENVQRFSENDICDDSENFLLLKVIMNLWNTRFPDFVLTQNNFTKIFQNYLGEIKVDKNNRLGWPNKQFNNKKNYNNDYWKQYIDEYLIKDDECFLMFSDLKISFKSWLRENRKKDKPKISEIKNYFSKHLCPWAHTKFRNNDVEGYKGWKIINK